jgi:hypothetical protein
MVISNFYNQRSLDRIAITFYHSCKETTCDHVSKSSLCLRVSETKNARGDSLVDVATRLETILNKMCSRDGRNVRYP